MKPQHRITDPNSINETEIDKLISEGKYVVVQFSKEKYTNDLLAQLNSLCKKYEQQFGIRFYGHYGSSFDCRLVEQLPNVKSLAIDCLIQAHHIESLTHLKNLERFTLGVHELMETDILNAPNLHSVSELFILDTKSKAFDLAPLQYFKQLKYLTVAGHTKNIDAIGTLHTLRKLRLNSISKVPLHFINRLQHLHTLAIILGGRTNINELEGNAIEDLELTWIRGLDDLRAVNRFQKLKFLKIEDQIRLTQLNFSSQLLQLEDIKIINCKALSSVTGLATLPSLKQFRLYKTNINFEEFIKQSLPNALKVLAFYTAKSKADVQIKNKLNAMGYLEYSKDLN